MAKCARRKDHVRTHRGIIPFAKSSQAGLGDDFVTKKFEGPNFKALLALAGRSPAPQTARKRRG